MDESLIARFWSKVDKCGEPPAHQPELGPCWTWKAARNPTGYGLLGDKRERRRCAFAHRISWEVHFGRPPDELRVLHRCDNPSCVNPSHLFLGTMADNCRDRDAKGRGRTSHLVAHRGVNHHLAKVTPALVSDLRKRYANGERQADLARAYSLTPAHVYTLVHRLAWKDA